jgi:uncharacterized protein YggE
MVRTLICLVVVAVVACQLAPTASAQMAAARLGVEEYAPAVDSLPLLDRKTAETFISLDGRAEVRVRPTQVRIVLAVTSEGKTAQECQRLTQDSIAGLRSRWQEKLGIPAEDIVEDFIAVLPVHSWKMEKRGEAEVGVEERVGFRMQTNIHLSVPNDDMPSRALSAAFEQGIADIIAVDYWSPEIDKAKVEAREQALQAARKKADLLLTTLFDTPPPVINVQERTAVRYPESLYDSFKNSYQEEVTTPARNNVPFIHAYRPRNTYYRGLHSDGDVESAGLSMQPEISVVSTVRLYYASPAARPAKTAPTTPQTPRY